MIISWMLDDLKCAGVVQVSMALLLQQDPTPEPVPFSLNPHPNPALYGAVSGNKPRSANLHFTDSTVMTTMRIEVRALDRNGSLLQWLLSVCHVVLSVPVWSVNQDDDVQVLAVRGPGAANSMSSPLFPEDFTESTLLQLDVEELQAYLAHQGYNIAKPCVSQDDTQVEFSCMTVNYNKFSFLPSCISCCDSELVPAPLVDNIMLTSEILTCCQKHEQIEKDLDRWLDGDRAWRKMVEEEISRVICEPEGS